MLELGGVNFGRLEFARGGGKTTTGPPGHRQTFYKPISIVAGFGLEPPFYSWLTLIADPASRSDQGRILVTDANGQLTREVDFEGVLRRVMIPGCDVAVSEKRYLGAEISPTQAQLRKASGTAGGMLARKNWRANNFALAIDRFASTGVTRIEPLTIEKFAIADRGRQRSPVVFPKLAVSVPKAASDPWLQWQGERRTTQGRLARNGQLVLLASDGRTPLATVRFMGLLIDKVTTNAAGDLQATMSAAEGMSLHFGL
jgi:hypothetical protein